MVGVASCCCAQRRTFRSECTKGSENGVRQKKKILGLLAIIHTGKEEKNGGTEILYKKEIRRGKVQQNAVRMPKLRVEYAKSGHAKCASSTCSMSIAKHEVRIGSGMIFPFNEKGEQELDEKRLSYKWCHLCCFSKRKLDNAIASGDLDAIDGFDDLAPGDKELVNQMKRGELLQQLNIRGRVGDVVNSPIAAQLLPKRSTPAKKSKADTVKTKQTPSEPSAVEVSKSPGKRERPATRKRQVSEEGDRDDGAVSDAMTEEFEVTVETSRPSCPYGEKCFRTSKEHKEMYSHGIEQPDVLPLRRRAVIKRKEARSEK